MSCPKFLGTWDRDHITRTWGLDHGFNGSPDFGQRGIVDSLVMTPSGEQVVLCVHDGNAGGGFMTNRRFERISLVDPIQSLGNERDLSSNGTTRIIGADDGMTIYSQLEGTDRLLKTKRHNSSIATIMTGWPGGYTGNGTASVYNPNTSEVFFVDWSGFGTSVATLTLYKVSLTGVRTTLASHSWAFDVNRIVNSYVMGLGPNGEVWVKIHLRDFSNQTFWSVLRWTASTGLNPVPAVDMYTDSALSIELSADGGVYVSYSLFVPPFFSRNLVNDDLSLTSIDLSTPMTDLLALDAGYSQSYSRDLILTYSESFSFSDSAYEGYLNAGARFASKEKAEAIDIAVVASGPYGTAMAKLRDFSFFSYTYYTNDVEGNQFYGLVQVSPLEHLWATSMWGGYLVTLFQGNTLVLRQYFQVGGFLSAHKYMDLYSFHLPDGVCACYGIGTIVDNYFPSFVSAGYISPVYATSWSGTGPYVMELLQFNFTDRNFNASGSVKTVLATMTTDTPEASNILQTRDGHIWFLAVDQGVRSLYQYSSSSGIVKMEGTHTLRKGIIPMGGGVWVATDGDEGYRVDANGTVSNSNCMSNNPPYAGGLVSPGLNTRAPHAPWGYAWITGHAFSHRTRFAFTGGPQSYTVPAGITTITVDVFGAEGGNTSNPNPTSKGGHARATIAVTPGETLTVMVGGAGGGRNQQGFNGGGNGGTGAGGTEGGSGGGASDIRRGSALTDRLLVAGGGGGTAVAFNGGFSPPLSGYGGDGGYPNGGDGHWLTGPDGLGGLGGTQSAGGLGGSDIFASGAVGLPGTLGVGGDSLPSPNLHLGGGGGGGGLYGGGAAGDSGAGGGGGSSGVLVPATGTVFENGVRVGNGLVVISEGANTEEDHAREVWQITYPIGGWSIGRVQW